MITCFVSFNTLTSPFPGCPGALVGLGVGQFTRREGGSPRHQCPQLALTPRGTAARPRTLECRIPARHPDWYGSGCCLLFSVQTWRVGARTRVACECTLQRPALPMWVVAGTGDGHQTRAEPPRGPSPGLGRGRCQQPGPGRRPSAGVGTGTRAGWGASARSTPTLTAGGAFQPAVLEARQAASLLLSNATGTVGRVRPEVAETVRADRSANAPEELRAAFPRVGLVTRLRCLHPFSHTRPCLQARVLSFGGDNPWGSAGPGGLWPACPLPAGPGGTVWRVGEGEQGLGRGLSLLSLWGLWVIWAWGLGHCQVPTECPQILSQGGRLGTRRPLSEQSALPIATACAVGAHGPGLVGRSRTRAPLPETPAGPVLSVQPCAGGGELETELDQCELEAPRGTNDGLDPWSPVRSWGQCCPQGTGGHAWT